MIIVTDDGSNSIYSAQHGVTYHSRYGAVTESAHVFIAAGLRYKAVMQQEIRILETGLGTGLNAMMTWLEAEKRSLAVFYTALEMFPVDMAAVEALNYPTLLDIPDRAADFHKIHQCPWEVEQKMSEAFHFTKHQAPIETYRSPESFDLIYFDAFAPQAQPELWTEEVFQNMFDSLKPDGVLVTYCAQGEFKRRLKRAGFMVERLQGPPGKREMTRGYKETLIT
jgi:tRNA U34 5-methylaminomethyl-2-thiouridine-forming methyltransferase MnmC